MIPGVSAFPHSPIIYGYRVETYGPYSHYYTRGYLFSYILSSHILTINKSLCQLKIEHLYWGYI